MDQHDTISLSTGSSISLVQAPSSLDRTAESFQLIDLDDTDDDSDSDSSSCSTSLVYNACDHEFMHGRRYHGYKRGRYPFPNDTVEQQREEVTHALMLMLTVAAQSECG